MDRLRASLWTLAILLTATIASAQTPTLSGRVIDTQGAAIPNAEVSLESLPSSSASMSNMPSMKMGTAVLPKAQTRDDGTFIFQGVVPPGQYVLLVDATGFERWSQEITVPSEQPLNVTVQWLELVQSAPTAGQSPAKPAGAVDTQVLLDRIAALEKRVIQLESATVLSEPETRTKQVEVWVDKNSNEYDHPVPGTKKVVTYQRERVYRRQTINEKIQDALTDQSEKSVAVGVSAAVMPSAAIQLRGPSTDAHGQAYDLASADLTFTARVAQYTTFFGDIVGLSGPTPETQIPTLTLLNSYAARLNRQNEVDVREAWIKSEFLHQTLAISAGRLDLTNYFDRNAGANDETRQFLSDALVNNPALGLISNGAGVSVVYDPKKTVNFKVGFQQNAPNTPSLSQSLLSLAEIGILVKPFSLPAGNYRFWVRSDNTVDGHKQATGVSFDQKVTDQMTFFGRVGYGYVANNVQNGNMLFYSGGFQLAKRFVFYPGDAWGIGFAQTNLTSGAAREHLGEAYYNFQLTERLRLSPRVQYLRESRLTTRPVSYFLPGLRLQAVF
jgi:carbohydrate-selective porin OprB